MNPFNVGDVLLAGPYKYRVEAIKGKFVQFSWIHKSIKQEMWVCINKVPPMLNLEEKVAA